MTGAASADDATKTKAREQFPGLLLWQPPRKRL